MIKKILFAAALSLSLSAFAFDSVGAAEAGKKPEKQSWHFDGPFGTYDKASLQRGFLVYKQVCSACHAMDKMHYRNLSGLGYSDAQIKAIASEYSIMDGPDSEGEMFERPGRPADKFKSPFANKNQAKAANGGAYPPDMSLINFGRKYGADYIYALLAKGYVDPPEGKELLAGQYYNKYMAGNVIAMAQPLSDGLISYPDGSPETVQQYSKDVAEFLQFASDPHMEIRKQIGVRAFIFLFFFTLVFYLAKKKLWKDVK